MNKSTLSATKEAFKRGFKKEEIRLLHKNGFIFNNSYSLYLEALDGKFSIHVKEKFETKIDENSLILQYFYTHFHFITFWFSENSNILILP